jgi:3-methyladenine DNA glycosylase AlkD
MKLEEVLKQLEEFGDERTKKTLMKHGAKEPFFGVKVGDLKKILKQTKKNHELSLALYNTGNSDAMYLAGLMADEKQISKEELQVWVENAYWSYLSEYAVPWVAAESPFGTELGLEWIENDNEQIESAGWCALAYVTALKKDEDLDPSFYQNLMERIQKDIHSAKNRVKYAMNGFVIAIGSNIPSLTEKAQEIGKEIGIVEVDMEGTACKVPYSVDYIQKVIDKNRIGKKRKTVRC